MQAHKATSCTIRIAGTADIPAMEPIINAAFGIEGFIEGERTNQAQLVAMMDKGIFLVGHDHTGKLIASVYVEIRQARGYFGMLAVDPAYQGKGIGRAMIDAAEDYCRKQKCNIMDLTVLSLRPELPPLYRKLGYTETGTEEFRPTRPLKSGIACHCIVMSKKL